jgi:type I restriction enzyme S subunit
MSEWKRYKLNEIASLSNGINFDKSAYTSGVKLIGVADFKDRVYPDYGSLQEVDSKVVRNGDYLEKGDIVFVRSNGNKELVGRCMMIDRDIPVTFSGFCIKLHLIDKNKFEPAYFNYLFRTREFKKVMTGTAVGANIQNLSQSRLGNCEINVPDIETQRELAIIISRYDSLIENYQKQIKLLEESAQRLYKEWFIDLRFPGHENTKIVDGVPEGWEKKKIKDLVDLKSGYAFKSSAFVEKGKYKIVTIKNVKDGVFDGDNVSYLNSVPEKMPSHCILQTGDILLSLTGNVGRICMVVGDNYLLNQRVAKLESKFPAFTYCLFRHYDTFVAINNLANGAAQQNVSPIRIGEMDMLVANDKIMHHFEKAAENIRTNILNLFSQIRHLTEARDRLLPKLMSGEIEV